ncbi:hypothetical protein [Acidithiobacillus albertensis]|jgi:hypothetical protein|uniref:hypothetical protein n=1 Tax=Acidithiobacillus albertensis TaxID=119978 RepID=UPI001C06DE2D|nr:hypothetical protein [Acidithiobacillus albertensis]MBU2741757.1 hypothetical protein [Acidithiobacillus albertensis]
MGQSGAERQRRKRERDRALVWGADSDESQLSDTALLEQIGIAYRKARDYPGQNAILLGLLKELMQRAGLPSK